jgi:lipopolysaccharide exporter
MRGAEVISSPVPPDLGHRMAKGAAWMIGLRFAIRGIGLVSTIILARLLVPADFGLVAIATALAGALAAMSEFGFQVALIQNQAADRRHYDTAWTLGIIRGLVVAGALAVAAAPLATTFADQRLEPVLLVLALGVVILSLENVGVVGFRKDLHFQREFLYRILARVFSFSTTIPLAFILRNHWALVFGIVAGQLASVLLSYRMSDYRPRLCTAAVLELMRFSTWLFFHSILSFLYHRADTFIIGRVAGAGPLGLYAVAHEAASLPVTEMVAPVRAALLPGYSKLASDRQRLSAGFSNTFGVIIMTAMPIAVGIGFLADPLVRVILGDQWLAAIPVLEILAIYGVINVCVANAWPVFIALGQPWINTALTGFGVAVLMPLLMWSVQAGGIAGAAWSLVVVAALVLGCTLTAAVWLLSLRPHQLLSRVWRSFAAAAGMIVVVVCLKDVFTHVIRVDAAILLLICIASGATMYMLTLWLLWLAFGTGDAPEPHAIRLIRSIFSP